MNVLLVWFSAEHLSGQVSSFFYFKTCNCLVTFAILLPRTNRHSSCYLTTMQNCIVCPKISFGLLQNFRNSLWIYCCKLEQFLTWAWCLSFLIPPDWCERLRSNSFIMQENLGVEDICHWSEDTENPNGRSLTFIPRYFNILFINMLRHTLKWMLNNK